MSFSDTYAQEVLQSRRTRAQRAGFWAKIVSFLLMITIAATLRSEPQLRQALMSAGMDTIMRMTGRAEPTPATVATPAVPDLSAMQALLAKAQASGQLQATPTGTAPTPRGTSEIKINRLGASQGQGHGFQTVPSGQNGKPQYSQTEDTQGLADQLGQVLKQLGMGS